MIRATADEVSEPGKLDGGDLSAQGATDTWILWPEPMFGPDIGSHGTDHFHYRQNVPEQRVGVDAHVRVCIDYA